MLPNAPLVEFNIGDIVKYSRSYRLTLVGIIKNKGKFDGDDEPFFYDIEWFNHPSVEFGRYTTEVYNETEVWEAL